MKLPWVTSRKNTTRHCDGPTATATKWLTVLLYKTSLKLPGQIQQNFTGGFIACMTVKKYTTRHRDWPTTSTKWPTLCFILNLKYISKKKTCLKLLGHIQ